MEKMERTGASSSRAPAKSLEADLEDELEKLRRKAAAQEESLNKYRVEAEKLISGSSGMQSDQSKANGMMKAWLRDAKKQSEELKALFEQSRAVAAESAAIAKRDYENKLARLKQDLAACESGRAAACSEKDATEQALQRMREQVASMCEQRDMARLELKEALEKHGWIILRLESEHREEVEKISAANKQYQELTREQSEKSAIQEKKTSVMFEHTLSEMKTMMERSRESREKERKTAAAMLESANQVAESHKRELDCVQQAAESQQRELGHVQQELNDVQEQLGKANLKLQELEFLLEEREDQHQRRTVLSTSFILDVKSAATRNQVLSRAWHILSRCANAGRRNKHFAVLYGAFNLRKHTVHQLYRTLRCWRNYLRLMRRAVGIKRKHHARVVYTALWRWIKIHFCVVKRARILDQREQRQNNALQRAALVTWHVITTDRKRRRFAVLQFGNKAAMQLLRKIIWFWSFFLAASTMLRRAERERNEQSARVVALSVVMAQWKAHFSGTKLRLQRVRIFFSRNSRRTAFDALLKWATCYSRKRRQMRVLRGRVQSRIIQLFTVSMRYWSEKMDEMKTRKFYEKEVIDSKKILQQQKDVLTGEVATLRDKLKNADDALNIAQKVNRVQENELAKLAKLESETVENLKGEVELSRLHNEAKEGEIHAVRAKNAIMQQSIKELSELVAALRRRLDQEETEISSGLAQAVLELHLEQSKTKILSDQLQSSEREIVTLKESNDGLQRCVLQLEEEILQRAPTATQFFSDTDVGSDILLVNFQEQEQVQKQARAQLEAKDSEAAAMRAQISLLQAALTEANLEFQQALDPQHATSYSRKMSSFVAPHRSTSPFSSPTKVGARLASRTGKSGKSPADERRQQIHFSSEDEAVEDTSITSKPGMARLRAINKRLQQELELALLEKQCALDTAEKTRTEYVALAENVAELKSELNAVLPHQKSFSCLDSTPTHLNDANSNGLKNLLLRLEMEIGSGLFSAGNPSSRCSELGLTADQIAGLEDMIHRLSANIGNTAGSPANSDNATSPDKDIPSRSVQSPQVRDTRFGSVSSPTRSTSSNISMPTVSPPVLNRTTTKYASDYYENTNPPPARAYSSARGSTGHSPSDSDDGVWSTPRRNADGVALHGDPVPKHLEETVTTRPHGVGNADIHSIQSFKSGGIAQQGMTGRQPVTSFSRRRVVSSDSDNSPPPVQTLSHSTVPPTSLQAWALHTNQSDKQSVESRVVAIRTSRLKSRASAYSDSD